MTFKDPLLTNEWTLKIGKDNARTINAFGSLIEDQDIFIGDEKSAIEEGERRAKLHLKKTRPTKLPFYTVRNTSGRLLITIISKKDMADCLR